MWFDVAFAQMMVDPYPTYASLRLSDPVGFNPTLQAWLLTRYTDCHAVLQDHATFSSNPELARSNLGQLRLQQRVALGMETPTVLTTDPPDHTRLRAIVTRAFTPARMERMRAHITEIADGLLARAHDSPTFDLITGLAQPLPIIVIAEMLGVPPEDREQFKRWSTAIASLTAPFLPLEQMLPIHQARDALADYLTAVLDDRRAHPRDDLISAIVQAEADGQRLTPDEALAFTVLLLVAGNETTTNLIGNGTLALARHPDQAARLRAEPSLWPTAIEELVRYDSPVQATIRMARQATAIGGHAIAEGDAVIVLLGAANRDPAQFPEPERLEVGRRENRHLGYGMGIHYCLGAPLARVEGQIALAALLRAFPDLALVDDPPEWTGTFALRGLARLRLRTA